MIIITGYIFAFMLILSVISAAVCGRFSEVSYAILASGEKTANLIISMGAGICLWSGIMKIAEQTGVVELLSKLMKPLTKRLFYGANEEALGAIVMNISANLLGLSNAATPMGIKAMKELSKDPIRNKRAMVNFCLVNTVGLQLIPTTVATLRLSAGSVEPFSIMPVSIAVSSFCLIFVLLVSSFYFRKEKGRL